jgi:hypothetical protein
LWWSWRDQNCTVKLFKFNNLGVLNSLFSLFYPLLIFGIKNVYRYRNIYQHYLGTQKAC